MITLYGPAKSSAGRCLWLLEELGIPYENKNVDMMTNKEHKSEWFLKINPMGKVPALTDGEFKLFESMAINQYLTEKYKPEFAGKTVEEKAITHQWSYWASCELQDPIIQLFIQKIFVPAERRDHKVIEESEKALPALFEALDNALANNKFLNGNEFTLADLNVASVASIAHPAGFSLAPYKNINAWLGAIAERPSFHRYLALRK